MGIVEYILDSILHMLNAHLTMRGSIQTRYQNDTIL